MKTLLLGLALTLNTAYAEIIPNLDCVGSVNEETVQLEYRDGAAAFMNVYYADLSNVTFIAVLNAANPVADQSVLPVTLIIAEKSNTLSDKNFVMKTNGKAAAISGKLEDGTFATLSCRRLPAL